MHEGPVVVFSGGGTGGHLYPALALADALRVCRPDVRAVFFGAERGLEARVLPTRGEAHHLLPVYGLDRSRPLRSWRAVLGLVGSLARVARIFARDRPEVVVVTGGYAGAPAGLVAALTGVPLVLQEQNSVPGVVTRLLSRWAERVYLAYPEAVERLPAGRERARVVGNPVRSSEVGSGPEIRAGYGVPGDALLVLVTGGSQGSAALNGLIGEVLQGWAEGRLERPEGMHLLWVTGPAHADGAHERVRRNGASEWAHAVPYVDDMPGALTAADLAISRAGAMSTAELVGAGLPAVLVPLPTSAEGHQMQNALALQAAGAAVVSAEAETTAASLWAVISDLLASADVLTRMGEAARSLARPDAAERIAADLDALLRAGGGRP